MELIPSKNKSEVSPLLIKLQMQPLQMKVKPQTQKSFNLRGIY